MRHKIGLWLFLFAGFYTPALAQLQHVMHQAFEIGDLNEVKLDLYGDFRVEPWAGNNLLAETQIKLYLASESILSFFLDNGRYDIMADTTGGVLTLLSKDQERRKVKTRHGECEERVRLIIYLPESFEKTGERTWARPHRQD